MNQIAETTRNAIRDLAAAYATEVSSDVPSDAVILVVVEPPKEPGKSVMWIVPGLFCREAVRLKRTQEALGLLAYRDEVEVGDCRVSMSAVDRKLYAKALDLKLIAGAFGEETGKEIGDAMRLAKGHTVILTMLPNALIGIASVPRGVES